jgi:hypothetical protein
LLHRREPFLRVYLRPRVRPGFDLPPRLVFREELAPTTLFSQGIRDDVPCDRREPRPQRPVRIEGIASTVRTQKRFLRDVLDDTGISDPAPHEASEVDEIPSRDVVEVRGLVRDQTKVARAS